MSYRNKLSIYITGLSLLFGAALAAAASPEDKIRQALKTVTTAGEPDSVRKLPELGLYEVTFGPQIFYATADGRFLIQGNVLDLQTREDITARRQDALRLAALNQVGEDQMIIFRAPKEKHVITVFTDIDCGYCRKLHNEVGEINDLGITVRYLFFPRSGPNTPSYYKARTVWCSEDRNKALTEAKQGKSLPSKTCDNPVDEHLKLVHEFGLNGTPAIILEDGTLVPGYVPAKKLARMLDSQ